MKKALSIILTVLLIASLGCNVYLFMTYKSTLNALADAKSETDTISASLSEKESTITEANTKIAELETTIADLQKQITELAEATNSDIEADITGVDGTVAEGDYDELDHPETTPELDEDIISSMIDEMLGQSSGGSNDSSNYVPEGWEVGILDPGDDYTGPQELITKPEWGGGEFDN